MDELNGFLAVCQDFQNVILVVLIQGMPK